MWAFALSPNGAQMWALVTDCGDTAKLTAHAYELPKLTEDEYFNLYHRAHMNELANGGQLMDEPTVDDIVTWFNAWLKEPISDRERVIISEVVNHVLKHPGDVARAVLNEKNFADLRYVNGH